jgi:hypothetical protein
MTADSTFLYLGCAALLIAVVMLGLSPKLRAGLFAVMILAALTGGHSQPIERVAAELVAAAD